MNKFWRSRKKVTPGQEERVWNRIDSLYSKLEEGKATEEEFEEIDTISQIIREVIEKRENRKGKEKRISPEAWDELCQRDREMLARAIGRERTERLNGTEGSMNEERRGKRAPFSRGMEYAGVGMVASVLLALGISFCLSVTNGEKNTDRTNTLASRVIQCLNDSVLHLTDGTVVHLAGGSHLSIADNFGKRDRTVALVGEAFFEVAKDKKRSFIVKTKEIDAIVHGTSFNVSAYGGTVESRVAVRTGCVEVAKGGQSFGKFRSGDRVVYDKAANKAMLDTVNPDNIGAWTVGGFVLEDATIEELKTKVKSRFHLELVIEKGAIPADSRINYCSYKSEQTDIRCVMKSICAIYGIGYEIGEGRIVITNQQQ